MKYDTKTKPELLALLYARDEQIKEMSTSGHWATYEKLVEQLDQERKYREMYTDLLMAYDSQRKQLHKYRVLVGDAVSTDELAKLNR